MSELSLGYIFAVLVIMLVVTFALRAVPFAILKPLRSSQFVSVMSIWMPAGILALLAFSIFFSSVAADLGNWWKVVVASVATVVIHLLSGRHTLLSIGLGTGIYVVLVNFL